VPRALKIGLILLLVGSGPLLVWMAVDPNSNPVGPGCLAFLTFWPAVILIAVGLIELLRRRRSKPGGDP
jgi:hypothetical protein